MHRIWLALALVLSLWSPPTAAGASVPARHEDRIAAAGADYAQELRQPAGTQQVVSELVGGARDPARKQAHTPLPTAPRAAPARQCSWRARQAPFDVRLPHGEHLPYFATAPPSRR